MRWLAIAAVATAATPAAAEPVRYGWLDSSDVLAAHAVELEARISELGDQGPLHVRQASLWLAPKLGVTDALELRLPFELVRRYETGLPPSFSWARYGAEVLYRVDVGGGFGLRPRLGVSRDVAIHDLIHAETGVAASWQLGRFHLLGDANVAADINRGGLRLAVFGGIAASAEVATGLRLGAELYGERSRDESTQRWAVVAPVLAWTRGRFWVAASLGIGLTNISTAPRLRWAIAF